MFSNIDKKDRAASTETALKETVFLSGAVFWALFWEEFASDYYGFHGCSCLDFSLREIREQFLASAQPSGPPSHGGILDTFCQGRCSGRVGDEG